MFYGQGSLPVLAVAALVVVASGLVVEEREFCIAVGIKASPVISMLRSGKYVLRSLRLSRLTYWKGQEGCLAAAIENLMVTRSASELEAVFRAHHARVLQAAYRVTGSMADAEDVAQSVFLRLARADIGSRGITHLESYLQRSAVNAALDLLRARRNRDTVPVEPADTLHASSAMSPERALSSSEIREQLGRALGNLHPRVAEMFTLRYLEELDNREIARLMNTSQAVVAVTLFRARAQLKKGLRGFRKGAL